MTRPATSVRVAAASPPRRLASTALRVVTVSVLVLGGAVVGFLRNADPVLQPVLYAEDGTWTADQYAHGFWWTVFHAREGFPVLGLVGLQKVGLVVTHLLHGDDISSLPVAYAVIAYLVVAVIAVLPLVLLRDVVPLPAGLVLYAGTLLMPLGGTGNEVVGRILNLGFLAPVVASYLVAWLLLAPRGRTATLAAAAVVLVCAMTLPVALVIAALGAGLLFLLALGTARASGVARPGDFPRAVTSRLWGAGLLVVACAVSVLSLPSDALSAKGGGTGLTTYRHGFVEYLGARSLLYPFVSWCYAQLSDPVVLLLAAVVAVLVVLGVLSCPTWPQRLALLTLAAAVLLNIAGLGLERGELTTYLRGTYTGTFPDRYFYGVNVSALALVLSAGGMVGARRRRGRQPAGTGRVTPDLWSQARAAVGSPAGLVVPALVLVVLALPLATTVALARPEITYREYGTFAHAAAEELCPTRLIPPDDDPATLQVPSYPVRPDYQWRITLPADVVIATGRAHAPCAVAP